MSVFDNIIDRNNTNCVKYDFAEPFLGAKVKYPMWVADMDFAPPPQVIEAMTKRLEHPVLGYSWYNNELKNNILSWVERRNKWKIDDQKVTFTPGVMPAVAMALQTFTNTGDQVIVQPPVYHPFFTVAGHSGREIVENPLIYNEGDYSMDFNQLEDVITEKTKVLMLCNPHNPVGRAWSKEELNQIIDICSRKDVMIISDEIHSDLTLFDYKHHHIGQLAEGKCKVISCISGSKTFNIAGMPLATIVFSTDEMKKEFEQNLQNFHLWIGNLLSIVASQAAYQYGESWLVELKQYLTSNYNFLKSYLSDHLPEVILSPSEATYLAWINFNPLQMTEDVLDDRLFKKAEIGLSNGKAFGTGGEGFRRLNFACPQSILEEALSKMVGAFKN